jgi:hypothetical protein
MTSDPTFATSTREETVADRAFLILLSGELRKDNVIDCQGVKAGTRNTLGS